MKLVVIGERGLIGSKTVEILRKPGHEVTASSGRINFWLSAPKNYSVSITALLEP